MGCGMFKLLKSQQHVLAEHRQPFAPRCQLCGDIMRAPGEEYLFRFRRTLGQAVNAGCVFGAN